MNRRHPRTVFVHTPSYSTIQWLVGFFLTTNKFFGEEGQGRLICFLSSRCSFCSPLMDDTDVIFFLIIFYLDGGRMDILFIYRDGTI